MDAPYYTGDDDREFGPEPGTCEDCGAGPAERCALTCACEACEADALAAVDGDGDPDGEAFRGDEAAADARDQAAAWQALK